MKLENNLGNLISEKVGPLETFHRDENKIIRKVRLSDGTYFETKANVDFKHSHQTPESDNFFKSWLRGPKRASHSVNGEVRIVDLFSGCGGLSLGIDEACNAVGKKPVHLFSAEVDEVYAQVYRNNFSPAQQYVGDITELLTGAIGTSLTQQELTLQTSVGAVDILCGGPPCQGHSDLNNYTRRADPRNSLYDRMARAAEVFRPTSIIIENVPGVRKDQTGVFNRTVSALEEQGYEILTITLNAADFGIPQNRKRTFVIAHLQRGKILSISSLLKASMLGRIRPVTWAINDLNTKIGEFDRPSVLSAESKRRVDWLFDTNSHELPDTMRPDCHRLKSHSYKSVYGRMYADRAAPTITTGCLVMGQGRFIHPKERRTITPHEAARIQTIPDFFNFGKQRRTVLAKMIGNAVPPLFSYYVGLSILTS